MPYAIESDSRGKLLGKFRGQLYFEKDVLEGSCLCKNYPLLWNEEDDAETALTNEVGLKRFPDCSVVELDLEEEEDECDCDESPSIGHRLVSLLFYIMVGLGIIIWWWVADGCKPISIKIDVPGLSYVIDDVPQLRQDILELKKKLER